MGLAPAGKAINCYSKRPRRYSRPFAPQKSCAEAALCADRVVRSRELKPNSPSTPLQAPCARGSSSALDAASDPHRSAENTMPPGQAAGMTIGRRSQSASPAVPGGVTHFTHGLVLA